MATSATPAEQPTRPPATHHRSDIQGLRAVAVLTVLAAHAGLPFVGGGFVGVDVFFVISGFLISQLLFREVGSTGSVGLRGFYARRARRILPAATLVIVVTVLASIVWLAVVEALEVVTDAWWSTFFLANVRFADVGTDYFAQDLAVSPLRHYWSLAVEEQFYLVWPLLLVVCSLGRRFRRSLVTGLLVAVTAASFAYGVHLTSVDPTRAYFSTPARAWELAVGALAALAVPLVARAPAAARSLLAASGLVAIAVACLTFGPGTPMPGVAAALPVLGSAAVLLAGAAQGPLTLPARLLGVRPMRVVGDWSYSLYLWHWPLLVIPESATGRALPAWGTAAALAGSFVLAGLTHRFVETPWRRPRETPRVRWVLPQRPTLRGLLLYPTSLALVGATCVGVSAYGTHRIEGDGGPITVAAERDAIRAAGGQVSADPTVALVQASVVAARNGHALPADLTPELVDLLDDRADVGECDYSAQDERELCARGDVDGDRTLVVLGNSHGRMWIPAFEEIAQRAGYRAYYVVKPNCAAADVSSSHPLAAADADPEPFTECDDFRAWSHEQVEALAPDLVVVSSTAPGSWTFDDDGTATRVRTGDPVTVREGYDRLFDKLDGWADRTVLLRDIPQLRRSVGHCLTSGDGDLRSCLTRPRPGVERLAQTSQDAAVDAGVEVVDPRPWLCWQRECPAVIGGFVSYRDTNHVTTAYAAELADDLGRALGLWDD